jgi:membrane fusion protein, multidrug efflux system
MTKTTFVMAGLLALAACSKPDPTPEPVRAVKLVEVGTGAFSTRYEYAGEVRAQAESRLGFRVGGKIIKRQADLGRRVKAGQVLAQLDPQDFRLAAESARAQVAAATTNRDLAAADFKRYQELKSQNFISGAELERRETALKSAEAQLQQAQSQFAVQGNQTQYASLISDVSGIVTAIEAEPGQVVAAGAPVVRVAADGPRDVIFNVPEDRLSAVKIGAPVDVRVWSQDTKLTGKIREISGSTDSVTRTFLVKASIESPTPPPLGATVYVLTEGPGTNAAPVIKLPTSALRQEGNSTAVWLLDKATMTVKSQPIQVATADGNEVVVAAGLQPGALVVSAGVHVLAPGQKVSVYKVRPAVVAESPAQTTSTSVQQLPGVASPAMPASAAAK